MRDTIKEVTHEVEGQEYEFRIHKMNALYGSFLMKFCAEKLIPVFNAMENMGKDVDVKKIKDEKEKKKVVEEKTQDVISLLTETLSSISEEELINFQIRCLQTVEMNTEAGWMYIMNGNRFAVQAIEYDTMTVLLLCYDVLEYNLSGFFGEKGLSSLLLKQPTSPSNA